MIGVKSWNEDYYGAEPTNVKEAIPYQVIVWQGGEPDLWCECMNKEMAIVEARLLVARGYQCNVELNGELVEGDY